MKNKTQAQIMGLIYFNLFSIILHFPIAISKYFDIILLRLNNNPKLKRKTKMKKITKIEAAKESALRIEKFIKQVEAKIEKFTAEGDLARVKKLKMDLQIMEMNLKKSKEIASR